MKRAILLAILMSALVAAAFTSTIRPAKAYTSSWTWLGQTHYYDPYFDTYWIEVFPEGTTATLLVTVYNSYSVPSDINLNISSVYVRMDWGTNYDSTQCSTSEPLEVPPQSYHTFSVMFTVPDTTVASNLVDHDYSIFVDQLKNASDPTSEEYHDDDHGSYFYLYSTAQKEAQIAYDEVESMIEFYDGYPGPSYPSWMDSFEAESTWYNGSNHYEMGLISHESGLFTEAKTHYEAAMDSYHDAIAIEKDYQQDQWDYDESYDRQMDDLDILERQAEVAQMQAMSNATLTMAAAMKMNASAALTNAEANVIRANATMKEAEATYALAQASMTQAYAWIVFGIGFIVFGVAAVVWANKR